MGVVTAFGSARKGLALAARAVADAVDRELVTGTSEQERRAAKALQRDTERAIARRALTYEKSKRTDLSFVDEANKKAVERQVTRSELVIGPARDPRSETFERDDGTTIEVADRTNDKRPNVWAPAYDADGRRVKPPSRGPKFDPPSHARVCVVDVLAARHLETRDAYITLDLTGERVGETSKSSVKAKGTTAKEKQIRFDASFAFAAAKRLSDDEKIVLTVRRASASDAIIGAVTIPVDAVEDANDPFVRDKKRDASHVRAFWTRLADPPPPPPPDVGTLKVACFADADAPGRIRVFVVSARSEGDFGDDGDDEGRGATTDATRARAGTCVPRVWANSRAFSSSPASYVRVSLNRVEPTRVAPKWDDRRRTATVRLGPDGVTYLFDESFTYDHVALDGDSSVSFELFREDALGGDDAAAQMSLPVKHLPRARDGDAASKPRDRKFNTHSRSRRHVSRRNEKDGEKSTGLVCVAACFLDVERTRLRVRVLEAKNVRAGDETGTSDPYVTATLRDGSKGLAKQVFRTKVVYGTTSPAWRHTFNFRVNENAARTGSVVLDLFDHDFGDFDADDFLGRVVLPLDAVATAGVSVDERSSRRAEWYPWRDKARADPLKGEVLIRAYFPFESVAFSSMDGNVSVRDTHEENALLDPSLNANAAALRTRAANIAKREAKQKARRLELEKHGLRRELETQLRVQLEQHDWPQDLATRYARAYAKHAHETHKIPPPPLGLVVPASFAHMFETAERAAGVFKTSSSSFRSVDDKEETMTKRFGESAEEGLRDEKNARVAEHVPEPERFFQTTGAPTDARSGAPSVPSWSVAAGGAASVYFQRSPTPRR